MYPLKLIAPLKDYLWGGDKLKTEWGKKTDLSVVAESWELSVHPDGVGIVANGSEQGRRLDEVLKDWPAAKGTRAERFSMFPVMVKLIHSKGNLSIQVHPSDEYALKNEKQYGKTEMWYIVDAEPGAGIYYGFRRDTTKEEYVSAIQNNTVTDLLNFVPVKKGESYFIPSGTVHAICSGLLICEIQQNSNVTYRVYDYDRVGADGKRRELHVDKAVAVSNLSAQSPFPMQCARAEENGAVISKLAECEYFKAYEAECEQRYCGNAGTESFEALTFLDGSGMLEDIPVQKGDTVFVPAGYGKYTVSGKLKFLITKV